MIEAVPHFEMNAAMEGIGRNGIVPIETVGKGFVVVDHLHQAELDHQTVLIVT